MSDDDGQIDWLTPTRPKTPAEQCAQWRELYDDGSYGPWFWQWLPDNLHILRSFCRMALQLRERGRTRWSGAMIVGQIRWECAMQEGAQEDVKINENAKTGLARLSMRLHPELAGFFETRTRAKSHARRLLDGKLYSEPRDDDDD